MELTEVQKFLNIEESGELDEFTQAAIRNFQIKTEIEVTGQPDTKTIDRILKWQEGFLDTDFSTKLEIKKYYLNPDEYFRTKEPKTAIFLHHTAGWNNPYQVVNDWERDNRGRIGTAYVVGGIDPKTNDDRYDGEIVECFNPLTGFAWHLGIGDRPLHRNSIGIEMCNFGWVTKDSTSKWRTYSINGKPGTIIDPVNIYHLDKPFRGYQTYIKYSDAQLVSVRNLLIELGNKTGIDITLGLQKRLKNLKDPYKAFDYDPTIGDNSTGVYLHTNVNKPNRFGNYEKWDCWPQPELIDMIKSL